MPFDPEVVFLITLHRYTRHYLCRCDTPVCMNYEETILMQPKKNSVDVQICTDKLKLDM